MKDYDSEYVYEISKRLTGDDFWNAGKLRFSDGPSGLRLQKKGGDSMGLKKSVPATGFPTHTALACSFNKNVVYEVAKRIGEEAAQSGVDILLAPAINLKRSPYNGRNFEYFSEDSFLSGSLGTAFVKGVQSCGVGACVKHFAANNRERGRSVSNSVISERTLNDTYLAAFEAVVEDASPEAVMTSYNKINGEYVNESKSLIEGKLRGEWGFKGIVISDWCGTYNRVKSVKAGADLEMPRCRFSADEIVTAFERGEISGEEIEACYNRIKKAELRPEPPKPNFSVNEHISYARRAAEECEVLLKNDGVLPLKKGARVALFGKAAKDTPTQGGGSSKVTYGGKPESLYSALSQEFEITGYHKKSKRGVARLMKKSDAAIVCLSQTERDSEGDDKTTLALSNEQVELVKTLSSFGKKVVCILISGGAVDASWDKFCNALLYIGLAGQGSCTAAANIISGKVNPSGRLAESFFNDAGEILTAKSFTQSPYFVLYEEGAAIGYRRYLRDKIKPKYPFGFGLGYTEFEYSAPAADESGVGLTLKNIGSRSGGEVVQVYLGFPKAANEISPKLVGFEKVFLNPGETARIFIPFNKRTFRSYDIISHRFVKVSGEYTIHIAKSSEDFVFSISLDIEGDSAGVPPDKFEGEASEDYPIERNKKGRVICDILTPFCELKNSKAALVRLVSRAALFFTRKNVTVCGTLRYAPVRMGAQMGGFDTRKKEGIVDLFNGRYLKGIKKFLFKGKKRQKKQSKIK